jgi:hypothetical protein
MFQVGQMYYIRQFGDLEIIAGEKVFVIIEAFDTSSLSLI